MELHTAIRLSELSHPTHPVVGCLNFVQEFNQNFSYPQCFVIYSESSIELRSSLRTSF